MKRCGAVYTWIRERPRDLAGKFQTASQPRTRGASQGRKVGDAGFVLCRHGGGARRQLDAAGQGDLGPTLVTRAPRSASAAGEPVFSASSDPSSVNCRSLPAAHVIV